MGKHEVNLIEIIANLSVTSTSKLLEVDEECNKIFQYYSSSTRVYKAAVIVKKLVAPLLLKSRISSFNDSDTNYKLLTKIIEDGLHCINETSKAINSQINKEIYSVSGLPYPNPIWNEVIIIIEKSQMLLAEIKNLKEEKNQQSSSEKIETAVERNERLHTAWREDCEQQWEDFGKKWTKLSEAIIMSSEDNKSSKHPNPSMNRIAADRSRTIMDKLDTAYRQTEILQNNIKGHREDFDFIKSNIIYVWTEVGQMRENNGN